MGRIIYCMGQTNLLYGRIENHRKSISKDANNCFQAVLDEYENLQLAERYWRKLPNLKGRFQIEELLADGRIEVVEVNRNL